MSNQPRMVSSGSREALSARLGERIPLLDVEQRLLHATGIRTEEELLSLLWNFPGLSRAGVNFPKLSNLAMTASAGGSRFMATAQQAGFVLGGPPQYSHGAMHPPGAAAGPGYQIPVGSIAPMVLSGPIAPAAAAGGPLAPAGPLSTAAAIDLRLKPAWPVRDQGHRGTCVAFASTACCEHYLGGNPDLSEQFLYWAIKVKVGDPWPTIDGTTLQFARSALSTYGICTAALWPYNGAVIPGNISQQAANGPSPVAQQDAGSRLFNPGFYQTSGGAAALLGALQSRGRPVAITVPVFGDVMNPQSDNWNTAVGSLYGRVLDPPPTSVVIGGHAICVTGFEPDASEPVGGWFIIRNSWNNVWATQVPAPGYYSPEIGYGQISAMYIDQYLWEIMAF